MGVVYEAYDRERQANVALKTLRDMTPESLLLFKNEFREFQDLRHPNLIALDELCSDNGQWFFTMELVEGVHFLSYVRPPASPSLVPPSPMWPPSDPLAPLGSQRASDRPTLVSPISASKLVDPTSDTVLSRTAIVSSNESASARRAPAPGTLDETRLRSAMHQLAQGLSALHAAGKIHRDIKPSNVLVTNDGRVVILDYGLATANDRSERLLSNTDIVGTVEYMAPEQAASRAIGPEADWYSVGTMLYEALTGELPIKGRPMEVLMNKQHLDKPHPKQKSSEIPDDLDVLCSDLLAFTPSARPDGRAVLERLGYKDDRPSSHSLSSFSTSANFVGRDRELQALRACFDKVRTGARSIAVCGESGVGKSTLVRRFVDQLLKREPGAVVLVGACYERERIPYKAIDGIVDSLSRYMRRLPKDEAVALLPRRASLLAQVFPVLQRVEAFAEAPHMHEGALDPIELRGQLFAALRELLARLSDRRPLVLVVDDLQWADVDSLSLLAELLREPEAPHLLLIATVRRADDQPLTVMLPGMEAVRVERLSPAEASELAALLLVRTHTRTGLEPQLIAQEAGGHPLFIDELIRYAASMGVPPASLQLEDALWQRITHLEPQARTILELICLASGRLVQKTACEAAGIGFGEFIKSVQLMRVAHLVRTAGMRAGDHVEPYHGRVRTAVMGHLDAATAAAHHRRLAVALETSGQPDPEALAVHWRDAGNHEKAGRFALLAAEKADRALAFDRAVAFYRMAFDQASEPGRDDLRVKLAYALVNAGRSAEAGAMFVEAADKLPPTNALVLKQHAAEQLLRAGHFDQALELFRTVQSAIGMPLAKTAGRAIAGLLRSRVHLRLRGLSFRERDVSQIPPQELARIDAGFAIALALSTVDTIRGADLQTRQLLAALSAGEPYRVARGIALEAAFNAAGGGTKAMARTARLVQIAQSLADRIANPHARGLAAWAAGSSAYLEGRFAAGSLLCEQAVTLYRDRCRGVAWEVASAQIISLWSRSYLGHYGHIAQRLPALLAAAESRDDRYDATNLRTSHTNTVWLAADQPDQARAQLSDAMKPWKGPNFHLPHYYALHAYAQADLYTSDAAAAWDRVNAGWADVKKSLLMRLQVIRIEMSFLRARAALAMACARPPAESKPLLDTALRDVRLLEREKAPWASALATLIQAGVMTAHGEAAGRDLYERAARAFDAVDMALHAAVARHRYGSLLGGDDGAALIAAAEGWMIGHGIRSPVRMSALLAPCRV
jgi:serine/threonine protein kinase